MAEKYEDEEQELKPVKEFITKEDTIRTEAKFRAWDKFIKGEIDEKYKFSLLKDPTIFAYAFLKNDDMESLRLRPFQDLLVNDQSQYVICASANQVGKTLSVGCVKSIHHALFVPNATVLLTSKNERLALKILSMDIKGLCLRSKIELADDRDSKSVLSIRNFDGKGVSNIVAVPPTDSALSWSPTLFVLDECGFYDNGVHFYNQVVLPRIGHTMTRKHPFLRLGQIFGITNPNRTQGLAWHLWNQPDYTRYRFDWLSHPEHTIEQFKKIKRMIPSDEFDSCYAAVFSSATGRFIPVEWFNNAIDEYDLTLPATLPVYFGLDLTGEDVKSRNTDFNSLYGGIVMRDKELEHPIIKVVYRKEWSAGTKRRVIFNEIKWLFNNVNFGGLAYDKMGVGDTVRETICDPSGPYKIPRTFIHPLTYSLQNKHEVFTNLRNIYEFGRIIHPEIKKLRDQMAALDFERTEGGYLKVHHYKESKKDDEVDALANMLFEAVRLSTAKASISFV